MSCKNCEVEKIATIKCASCDQPSCDGCSLKCDGCKYAECFNCVERDDEGEAIHWCESLGKSSTICKTCGHRYYDKYKRLVAERLNGKRLEDEVKKNSRKRTRTEWEDELKSVDDDDLWEIVFCASREAKKRKTVEDFHKSGETYIEERKCK